MSADTTPRSSVYLTLPEKYSISLQPVNSREDAISSPALVEYSLFAERIADMGYKWLRRLRGDNCTATPGHILRRHLCGGNWFEGLLNAE